jgi:hypothetical protein
MDRVAQRRGPMRSKTRDAKGTHAAHPLTELPPALLADYDGPVGVGTVIRVDTSLPVDVAALADEVRRVWSRSRDTRRA